MDILEVVGVVASIRKELYPFPAVSVVYQRVS